MLEGIIRRNAVEYLKKRVRMKLDKRENIESLWMKKEIRGQIKKRKLNRERRYARDGMREQLWERPREIGKITTKSNH